MLTHPMTSLRGLGDASTDAAKACLARTIRLDAPRDACTDAIVANLKRLGYSLPVSYNVQSGYTLDVAKVVMRLQQVAGIAQSYDVGTSTWIALMGSGAIHQKKKETFVAAEKAKAEEQARIAAMGPPKAGGPKAPPGPPVEAGPSDAWKKYALIGGGGLAVVLLVVALTR